MGAGLACAIVHKGGAAHAQYRLCARITTYGITERLQKILKIFTRNTESTVDAVGNSASLTIHQENTVPWLHQKGGRANVLRMCFMIKKQKVLMPWVHLPAGHLCVLSPHKKLMFQLGVLCTVHTVW